MSSFLFSCIYVVSYSLPLLGGGAGWVAWRGVLDDGLVGRAGVGRS